LVLVLRALQGRATYTLAETDDCRPLVIITHGHSVSSFIEPDATGCWVVVGALAIAPTPLGAATAGAACLKLAKLIVGDHAALLELLQEMLDRVD